MLVGEGELQRWVRLLFSGRAVTFGLTLDSLALFLSRRRIETGVLGACRVSGAEFASLVAALREGNDSGTWELAWVNESLQRIHESTRLQRSSFLFGRGGARFG